MKLATASILVTEAFCCLNSHSHPYSNRLLLAQNPSEKQQTIIVTVRYLYFLNALPNTESLLLVGIEAIKAAK